MRFFQPETNRFSIFPKTDRFFGVNNSIKKCSNLKVLKIPKMTRLKKYLKYQSIKMIRSKNVQSLRVLKILKDSIEKILK